MNQEELEKKADLIINTHLGFAMVAGAIPVPVVDLIAVTAIQLDMLQQLADLYEVDFNNERGKSLVSALVGSAIGTTLGRMGASAVKSIPGIGTILGIGSQVVLSGATTFAVGKIFQSHFQNNGTLFDFNVDSMKIKFEEFLNIGKRVAEKKEKEQSEDDIILTIEKIKTLMDKGIISKEEFEKTKKELLNKLKK